MNRSDSYSVSYTTKTFIQVIFVRNAYVMMLLLRINVSEIVREKMLGYQTIQNDMWHC